MYFKQDIHQVLMTFISYSSRFPVTLSISYEQSSWVRGENTSLHDTWKIPFLMFLLGQLNEAKTLVQEDKANLLQGLIDILVRI